MSEEMFISDKWILSIDGKPYFTFDTDEEARDFMDELGTDDTWELGYVSGC